MSILLTRKRYRGVSSSILEQGISEDQKLKASKAAQWVKVLAAKAEDLSVIHGSHKTEREREREQTPTCLPTSVCAS